MAFSISLGRKKKEAPEAAEPALSASSENAGANSEHDEAPAPAGGAEKKEKKAKRTKGKKLPPIKKKSCFVLMIGDDGGILTYVDRGRVARRIFSPSAEERHIKPFLDLLRSQPKLPLYLLCDMIDQSYVRHSLPPVSPLSIKKLVNRRLNRDFAPEDIKGSIPMGREKTGRKEWNFLLISLANSHGLQQWMDPILQAPNRCKGLYLVPVESQGFINHLSFAVGAQEEMNPSEWKILVAHDKVGGFRQTVLHKGQLIFTRLTQLPSDIASDVMAGNIEQEIQNTIEYLRRMSFDEADGLDIFVVVAQDVRDLLEPQKMGAKLVKLLTPFDVSNLLNLDQAALSGDRFADVVFSANFAMRQKPALKLLPGYAKKLDQLYQAAMGVKAFSAIALLYILYMVISTIFAWQGASGSLDDAMISKNAAQAEYADAQRRFDALGDDQTLVMRVSELYRNVKEPKLGPLEFVSRMAEIKGDSTRVVDWVWSPTQVEGEAAKTQKLPFTILARVEILDHQGDTRELALSVAALMEKVKMAFSDYEVTRSLLRKEAEAKQEKENVVIDLNQPAVEESFEMQAGDEFITIQLQGPILKKEGA